MAKVYSTIEIPVAAAITGGALQGFVWDNIVRGHKVSFGSDVVTLSGLDASVQPTFAELEAIVTNGGRFEGIKLAIRFANGAAAGQDVPAAVRGATYIDDNNVEQQRSWIDWFRANSTVQIITNGTEYAAKAVFNGSLLTSEELTAIHAQTGVEVLEWAAAVALYADELWTDYEL